MLPEPTTSEWCAAAAAALLIATVAGLHLVRPAVVPGTTAAGRMAGWLLACLASSAALVSAVLVGAGIRAAQISLDDLQNGTHLPSGPFVRYLFDRNPDSTERVAQYAPAVLLPLAATLAVLALAAVDVGRSVGLRVIAAVVSLALAAGCLVVGLGDVGPLASRTTAGIGVLALAAALALAADELIGRPAATPEAARSRRDLGEPARR